MAVRQCVVGTVLALLVGCGTDAEGPAPVAEAVGETGPAETGGGVFLRSLPDACEYLPKSLAEEILHAEAVRRPHSGGACSYHSADGSRKFLGFTMAMWNLDMIDSRTEPREKLEEKASFLVGGDTPVATLDEPGNLAFVFSKDANTSLLSLTGIGGTAVTNDRIASELSVSYNLTDAGQTHEDRLAILLTLATDHLSRLRELASTTHGAPAPM